ncbi:MAG: chorismate-binding protein [Anaerolineales bacterium]
MAQSHFKTLIDIEKPFAIFEKEGMVTCYQGDLRTLKTLDDIHKMSLESKKDVVFLLPYRTIRERGFKAIGDEPILAIAVATSLTLEKSTFVQQIQDTIIEVKGEIVPSVSDEDYAKLVSAFQSNEIAGGNTSQTILSRQFRGSLKTVDPDVVLSIYKKLLGALGPYMTILFANIDPNNPKNNQFIVSATPERHLEISGNEAIMIPIAGTLRKEDRETFPERLRAFVKDEKEINELFQIVDEEMKMMAVICPDGGEIRGPFLREIGAVVHTEYELVGRRPTNTIDALRNTLHAPTVTGSPIESAARIISTYENESRRYYGGEAGIYKAPRTPDHYGDLDTAILIRGIEIFGDGNFSVRAGGGLVKDSVPESEAKETHAKAMGVLSAIKGSNAIATQYLTMDLEKSVADELMSRNQRLSSFWMQRQTPYAASVRNLHDKNVIIVNNEDNFVYMIKHMLALFGANARVVDTFAFNATDDKSDVVILGPGPGDPTDMSHPRMKRLQDIIGILKQQSKPILGICLGHQALSVFENIAVEKQDVPTQGEARCVDVFNISRLLGFYNSFSPVYDGNAAQRSDISFDLDSTRRIIAARGENFIGFQFHPESVMSKDGGELLYEALVDLTTPSASSHAKRKSRTLSP